MQDLPPDVHYASGAEAVLRDAGLRIEEVFTDPRIDVWRDLPERQNCTLEPMHHNGYRLHIKRYKAPHGPEAAVEARGIALLEQAGIATVPLVAWGVDPGGRGFLITRHLASFVPADSQAASILDQNVLVTAVANTAAKLHAAGLHHRDLYLCHFLVNPAGEVRLIDPGRVARLPMAPLHYRWLVKDIAQLSYSIWETGLRFRDKDGNTILDRYMQQTGLCRRLILRLFVPIKVMLIARHDRKLRQKQPGRRVSFNTNS